jgi:hydrogenase/urease accessory protein HupE
MRVKPRLLWPFTLSVTQSVFAHGSIEGIGDFYNALLHPFITPAHLLALSALGLLMGQHEIQNNRTHFLVFVIFTAIGLALGSYVFKSFIIENFLLGGAAIIGIFISLHLIIKPYFMTIISSNIGFFIGLDLYPQKLTGLEQVLGFTGALIGVSILLLHTLGIADYCEKKAWKRVGVRVVGSWIAASATLVLALFYSKL